jgi:hypothetical protein
MEHVGSAHTQELEALKAVAAQRRAARQQTLELGMDPARSVAGRCPGRVC